MTEYIDIKQIDNDLTMECAESFAKLNWLEQSYNEPKRFWHEFKSTVDQAFSVGGVSRIFYSYNFFYDIIHRNRDNTAAFCWYDSNSGLKEMSYKELGNRATQRAAAWSRLDAQPGQTFCIVKNMSIELAIDLLAALKNGYLISFLPPSGKAYLNSRLDALQPDFIVTDAKNINLLPSWSDQIVPEYQSSEYTNIDADKFFTYPTQTIVFRCFDPCSSDILQTIDITSDSAFLLALRDGFLTLGLKPGDVYAAPGMHLLETQPFLLLAGLLCGSTYFHLLPEQIAANPELVTNRPIKMFGVSKQIRDILIASQIKVGDNWKRWFRNPLESSDFEKWHSFVDSAQLKNAYAYNCKWEVALGGCALISVGRKGTVHMKMLPAPGVAWTLRKRADIQTDSVTGYGIFNAALPGRPSKEQVATHTLMVMANGQVFPIGSSVTNRQGIFFSIAEVLACLNHIAVHYGVFFSIAEVPAIESTKNSQFILLVFTGASVIDKKALLAKINFTICDQMGNEFQPDSVKFFPIFPRFVGAVEIDHKWCQEQYISGGLSHKSKDKIFKQLALLRANALKTGAVKKGLIVKT